MILRLLNNANFTLKNFKKLLIRRTIGRCNVRAQMAGRKGSYGWKKKTGRKFSTFNGGVNGYGGLIVSLRSDYMRNKWK